MPSGRFFVRIGHLTEQDMLMHGFHVVEKDEFFMTYQHYSGEEFVVELNDPWLVVDDYNDAVSMSISDIFTR